MILCQRPECQTTAGCKCRTFPAVTIPIETTAAAWKQIADDRLTAVEMWKDKCAAHDVEIKSLRALILDTRSRAVNLATLLESAMRDALNIEAAANERPRNT